MAEDWETAWRKEDFSWAGLKKRRVSQMGKGVSLQDYWRRGPGSGREHDRRSDEEIDLDLEASGELVTDIAGTLWHLAHAPPDGTVAKKLTDEGRSTTSLLLKRRLDAAAPRQSNLSIWPAQLQGARITCPIDIVGISALALNAEWAGFAADCCFDEACFASECAFNNAHFGPATTFKKSVFGDRCRFVNTEFERDISFEGASFGMLTQFIDAIFGKRVSFECAEFGDYAVFSGSKFDNLVRFMGTTFGTGPSFANATFKEVSFVNASFGRKASFLGATFLGFLDFGFDAVNFTGNSISMDASGIGDISFDGAVFDNDASFANRTFRGSAVFDRTVWRGIPLFHGCTVRQDVSFSGATFPCLEREHWRYPLETPPESLKQLTGYGSHTDYDLAREARARRMEPPLDPRWVNAWRKKGSRWTDVARQQTDHVSFEELREALEKRYADMERAFRTLKLLMENVRSKTEEARFFRLELIARRRRFDRRMVSRGEIFCSWLYWKFADYGESLIRPIIALAFSIPLFALSFWGLAGYTLPAGNRVWDALGLSARNIFQPFSIWSAEGEVNTLPVSLRQEEAFITSLLNHAPWPTRLLSTSESLFAIAMIFLFLLALRRRFQIS